MTLATPEELVARAHQRHHRRLLCCPGVTWVGIGRKMVGGRLTKDLAVVVAVERKRPKAELRVADVLPTSLSPAWWDPRSVKTDVVESGKIVALATRTGRWRPAPGGVSIGHYQITAGTLGCNLSRQGQPMILSNNHVLANSNGAKVGDAILQPGAYDKGQVGADTIAHLEAFAPITFDGEEPPTPPPDQCPAARAVVDVLNRICRAIGSQTRYLAVDEIEATPNYVDAAVARPVNAADLDRRILGSNDQVNGTPGSILEATVGLSVVKSGRTTGYKTGRVSAIQATVRVSYGAGPDGAERTATFEDQIVVGTPGFSAGGDSGSAILSLDNHLVGLLFAGSDQQTIGNRIRRVADALGLDL